MILSLIDQVMAAKRACVPLLTIETLDAQSTEAMLTEALKNSNAAVMGWDIIRALQPLSEAANRVIPSLCGGDPPEQATLAPTDMLSRVIRVPKKSVVFMRNAHRFVSNESVAQALCNLRDVYKSNGSTLIMLAPSIVLPDELKQDVMVLNEPLPTHQDIEKIVRDLCEDAKIDIPDDIEKLSDILVGLSAFSAEQTFATSLSGKDINREVLWDRKCSAIEQTDGLSIWKGSENFNDIKGCDYAANFLRKIFKGKNAPLLIVFID
jgi:hypothetical protein